MLARTEKIRLLIIAGVTLLAASALTLHPARAEVRWRSGDRSVPTPMRPAASSTLARPAARLPPNSGPAH